MSKIIKRKSTKCIGLIMIAIAFSVSIAKPIKASAAPTQHSFGYNHPTISYYSAYRGATFTLEGIDTYNLDAVPIHNALNNIGYYNAYSFQNNTAPTVQSVVGSDAIFYITGHGGPGRVTCVSNNSTNASVSLLAANSTSDNQAYSLQYKYSGTTNKLRSVKLAFFNTCNSASTDTSYGYGNLLDMSYNLGVDCSLGFSGTVNTGQGAYFAMRVLSYYGGDSNNTISASCVSAKLDTINAYGTAGGVDTYVLKGNGSIKIAPASYGTY